MLPSKWWATVSVGQGTHVTHASAGLNQSRGVWVAFESNLLYDEQFGMFFEQSTSDIA